MNKSRNKKGIKAKVGKKKKYKLNKKRLFTAIFILLLFNYLLITGIKGLVNTINHNIEQAKNNQSQSQEESLFEEPKQAIPSDISINFVAIGDIMCHDSNYKAAYNSETKTYDFLPVFKNVAQYIKNADIAIGNLETTFAGEKRNYSGYPNFNSPKELGIALKDIGVDVLSTANNHCMDKLASGLEATLDTLDEIGISHTGTNRSKEEQDTILIKDVKGIKIAFIAFTYGTNGIPIPDGKEYLVNIRSEWLIKEQIKLAKAQNPDIICASMHWGVEYSQKQNQTQEKWADFLFKNGVDIIIGNHAHVIQPMEKRRIELDDGSTKDGFVVYALGNFVSGQVKEHTKSTSILNLEIIKNGQTGKISINNVSYIPVYCYDKGINEENRYELLDIKKSMNEYESGDKYNINEKLYNTLKKELENFEKVYSK